MDIEPLFQAYKDDVYRLAMSYTRSAQEAEDICQIVFLKLMEHSVMPGKERAWLMQVTANQCRSLLRSSWWRKTAPLEEFRSSDQEKHGEVYAALMTLPPKYRVVLYLHYYERSSTAEIAKLLHISQSTVTTRLSRGRQLMKEMLKEAYV